MLAVGAVADVEFDVVNMSLVEVVFVLPVAPFPLHNCPLYFHLVSRTLHWRHTVTSQCYQLEVTACFWPVAFVEWDKPPKI